MNLFFLLNVTVCTYEQLIQMTCFPLPLPFISGTSRLAFKVQNVSRMASNGLHLVETKPHLTSNHAKMQTVSQSLVLFWTQLNDMKMKSRLSPGQNNFAYRYSFLPAFTFTVITCLLVFSLQNKKCVLFIMFSL